MSLVVAHRLSNGVRFGSDLRTTLPSEGGSRGFAGGALKLVILHKHVCVGFAGSVAIALEAIRKSAEVITTFGVDDRNVLEAPLVEASATANVEFVLATLCPVTLCKIAEGTVERDLASAWIGDTDAFAAFQDVFVEGNVSLPEGWTTDVDEYRDLHRQSRERMREQRASFMTPDALKDFDVIERAIEAIREVVAAPDVASVGEAEISVSGTNEDEGFHYLPRAEMHRGSLRPDHPSGVTPIEIGSAAMGDYAVIISVPDTAGVAAIGVYFVELRLGYLFLPLRQDVPMTYRDLPASEFHEGVKEDHGVSLTGIGITSAG